MRNALRRYKNHRHHAKARGILFELTFDEWYNIWRSSGHMLECGIKKGQYVMARFNDLGAYTVGNVEIITGESNRNQKQVRTKQAKSLIGKHLSKEHRAKLSKAKIGNKNKLGKKESIETRAKKSIALIGNKNSVGRIYNTAARAKLSQSHIGARHTKATKRKIAEAKRRWWELQHAHH